MRTIAVMALAAGLISTAAAAHSVASRSNSAAAHKIPETGILSGADLISIAKSARSGPVDQFSDDPALAFVGREFMITVTPDQLATKYDTESHTLTIGMYDWPIGENLELARSRTQSRYWGQNGYGVRFSVWRERREVFGIKLSMLGRKPIQYVAQLDGDAARALSRSIRLRLSGKISRSDECSLGKPVVVCSSSSHHDPTFAEPNDISTDEYHVSVSLSRAEWVDARSGAVLATQDLAKDEARPSAAPPSSATSPRRAAVAPPNIWLELASGRSADALSRQFDRMNRNYGRLFKRVSGYLAEGSDRTHLIVGPFSSVSGAGIFADELHSVGIDAFRWSNSDSDRIVPINSK